MSSIALGVGAACGASALYNIGVALQAFEARRAPASEALRLSLLARLIRRPRWMLGLLLGVAGWPLQVVALLLAPLTLVQPTLGIGLILLLPIGALALGERVRWRDAAAVVVVLAGVALLAAVSPARHTSHAGAARMTITLALVAALALAPYLGAFARSTDGRLAALAAGAAFGWGGLSTKFFSDAAHAHHWIGATAWAAATGIASGVALLSESTALQQRPVHDAAPTVFAAQVLIPVATAPLLVGEAWSGTPLRSLTLVAGLAAMLAGLIAITRSTAVGALTTAEID